MDQVVITIMPVSLGTPKKHDELYEPLHSSQLRSRVTADERLRIQPNNSFNTIGDKNSQTQRTSPLTSYIDLSNYDSNSIKLNITQFSQIGILDIDGFGQSKDLILYNNSNQYVSVNYKPNSVVIDEKHIIRFFDEGAKVPDASISIAEIDHPSTQKGRPINYLSPDAIKVLNTRFTK